MAPEYMPMAAPKLPAPGLGPSAGGLDSPISKYLSRYKDLKARKDPWNIHYQMLAEAFLTRKASFTETIAPGAFLQEDVFDNTGAYAANLSASTFLSMLWPDASRSFVVRPVRRLRNIPGVEAYFRFVTDELHSAMGNAKAGLHTALLEMHLEDAIFGTAGIGAFEGPGDDLTLPVVYESWGIKSMCVCENAQGYVDTIYYCRQLTVRQLVEEYGKDKSRGALAPQIWERYKNGRLEDQFEVLYVLEPSRDKVEGAKGVKGMAYASLHIDVAHQYLMRRSGFEEMPVFVTRFFKTIGEEYGRSPGMLALPDVSSLNALSEAVLVAAEKQLDPPLGVLDDGRLGGGVIDTSAKAVNVFNTSGRLTNGNPVFPLFTVGEFSSVKELRETLKQSVMQAFFLDRLLDLNNQTQMTAYETSVRNRMRGEAMSSVFARKEAEIYIPLIERTFNIMFRKGLLGVVRPAPTTLLGKALRAWARIIGETAEVIVPDAVAQAAEAGLDVFEIEFISPAKRFMQSEKLQGIFTASESLAQLGPVLPGVLDNIDTDEMARQVITLSGAPTSMLRTEDEVRDIRATMAKQQQAAIALESAKAVSEVSRNAAQAQATLAGAGIAGSGMNGGKGNR